jgi:hypothetical protein
MCFTGVWAAVLVRCSMTDVKKVKKVDLKVKGIKEFHGHDGGCWECSLYVDGKRTAIVTEDGYGGPLEINPVGKYGTKAYKDALERIGDAMQFAETLPQVEGFQGHMMDNNLELHIETLVNEALELKEMKKTNKKGLYFLKPGAEEGTWTGYKGIPDTPDFRRQVIERHGDVKFLADAIEDKLRKEHGLDPKEKGVKK